MLTASISTCAPCSAAASAAKRTLSRAIAQLRLAVEAFELVAGERVELRAPDRGRQLERDRHVGPEGVLERRVADQPAIARGHVARVEVQQRHLDAGVCDRRLDRGEVLAARPPQLDHLEARLARTGESLEERHLREQDRDVGAEPHGPEP